MRLKFYYQFLPLMERKIYCDIVKGIKKHKEKIQVIGDVKKIKKILNFIYYDYPEFFYVDTTKISFQSNGITTIAKIGYHKNLTETRIIERDLENVSMYFMDQVQKTEMDNLKLIRYVHNFIIENVEYASENAKQRQFYGDVSCINGVFLNHKALCKGISLAAKWLLDKVGIMSTVIEGRMIDQDSPRLRNYTGADDEINHVWNLVCVNNIWHFMDVTMDLGSSENGWISYDYFLRNNKIFDLYVQYKDLYVSCQHEMSSYFITCKVVFSETARLKKYLEYCKRNKKTRIYFQLIEEASKIKENQIMELVGQYIVEEYRYRINKEINIYDILII